jgi:prephenate dehydratase
VECQAFADLFLAVESGRADAAVMAIENTVSGGLLPNFGLLRQSGRKIKCA